VCGGKEELTQLLLKKENDFDYKKGKIDCKKGIKRNVGTEWYERICTIPP
jgi:hypothetical protein